MNSRGEKRKVRIIYLLFAAVLIFVHFFFVTGSNDDAWFAQILDNYKLMEYLGMRYKQWTSRLLIEAAVVFFTRINPWLWKLANTLVVMLLVYACVAVFGKRKNCMNIVLMMSLVLLFPVNILSSAGWITTTINYLWPITAGVFSLIPLCKWLRKETVYQQEYILGCGACLFGCCQEQVAAVLFVTYVLYACYCVYQKCRLPVFWWLSIVIAAGMLLFILTCPGNANRSILETQTWFPEFADANFFEKLLMGYLTTFSYYISCKDANTILVLLSYILVLAVFATTRKIVLRGIALYPLFVTAIWGLGGRIIMKTNLTSHTYWLGLLQNDRIAEQSLYNEAHIFLECIVFFSFLCAVIASLFVIFGKTSDFLLTTIILFAGLCSRIVIGFSPTVYVSGDRTAALGYVCFMILIFLLLQKCLWHITLKRLLLYYVPVYFVLFTLLVM